MIAFLAASGLLKWAAGIIAALGGVWVYGRVQRHGGRVDEASDAMAKRAADKAAKLTKRTEIDHEIDQDVDLVSRAHAAGVVRHTEH